jgi:uncharacterized protein YndB with AHSA1/START domain
MTDDMLTVERETWLDAEPADVWSLLTDAESLGEWLGGDATIDCRPGGAIGLVEDDRVRIGVIDAVEPGERVAFTWTDVAPGDDRPPSTVEIVLEPADAGTHLRVTERRLELVAQPEHFGTPRACARV